MALTAQEQAELAQLESQYGSQTPAPASNLTAAEQQELASLEAQFGQQQQAPTLLQQAQGIGRAVIEDVQKSNIGDAVKAGAQKVADVPLSIIEKFPLLRYSPLLRPSVLTAEAVRGSDILKPTEGFQPTTVTEQLANQLVREAPTALATGGPLAGGVAGLLAKGARPLLSAAGSALATSGIEAGIGSIARQIQDKELSLEQTKKDVELGLKFGAFAALPLGAVAARASSKLARTPEMLAEGKAAPLASVEGAGATRDELSRGLSGLVTGQAKINQQIARQEDALARSAAGKSLAIETATQREGALVDRLSQRAATVDAEHLTRAEDLQAAAANIDFTQPQRAQYDARLSALEGRRQELTAALENARLDGESDRVRAALEGRRQEISTAIENARLSGESDRVRAALEGRRQDINTAIENAKLIVGSDKVRANLITRLEQTNSDIADLRAAGIGDDGLAKNLAFKQKTQQRINETLAKRDIELSKISNRLDLETVALQSRRADLTKELEGLTHDGPQFQTLQKKLQDNLEKQALITDAQKGLVFDAPKGPIGSGLRAKNTIEEIHDRALAQTEKVDAAVAKGLIREEVAPQLKAAEYRNALIAQGVDPAGTALTKPTIFGQLLNNTTRFNLVQKRTGARTGEIAERAIAGTNQATNYIGTRAAEGHQIAAGLEPLGISKDEATRLLQYYEIGPDGKATFTPTPYKHTTAGGKTKVDIPEYNGPNLAAPENAEANARLAALSEFFFQEGQKNGVGLLKRYVPLRNRPELAQQAAARGSRVEDVLDPAFNRERLVGRLDPAQHETNIDALIMRYTRESARNQYLGPVLQDGMSELMKLRQLGAFKDAEDFSNYLIRAFNLKDKKELVQVFGDRFSKDIQPLLNEMASATPDPEGALKQFFNESTKAMYANLVGLNPRTWIQQAIQPEFVGGVELGVGNIARARAAALVNPKLRKQVSGILKQSLTDDLSLLDEALTKPTTGPAKALAAINRPGEAIARRTMGKLEENNRVVSAIAAGIDWDRASQLGAAAIDRRLLDLTAAEMSLIRKQFKQGGDASAREMYQIIRTRRINFAYSAADKPEILAQGIGRYIPFTTFARNIVNRTIEDMAGGNYTKAISRYAAPLTALYAFEKMTGGRTIAGASPLDSVTGLPAALTPAPQVLQPLTALAQKGPAEAISSAADTLTPYGPLKRAAKTIRGERPLFPNKEDAAKRSLSERILKGFNR